MLLKFKEKSLQKNPNVEIQGCQEKPRRVAQSQACTLDLEDDWRYQDAEEEQAEEEDGSSMGSSSSVSSDSEGDNGGANGE